jgi:hypothetical protein
MLPQTGNRGNANEPLAGPGRIFIAFIATPGGGQPGNETVIQAEMPFRLLGAIFVSKWGMVQKSALDAHQNHGSRHDHRDF